MYLARAVAMLEGQEPEVASDASSAPEYRCYMIKGSGRFASRRELCAADDVAAVKLCGDLLEESEHPTAEVWQRTRLVHRLMRAGR